MSRAVDGSVAERRAALPAELVELAHRANIEVGYVDAFGTERVPSPDALLAVLRAYGHDIDRVGAAGDALRADDRRRAERGLPPVVVAWDGAPTVVEGVVPLTASRVSCRLTGEDGSERRWDEAAGAERIAGGERRNAVTMTIPDDVPPGIWMLEAEAGDWSRTATVVAAPARAYPATRRRRGVFVPLHALHSTLSWGAGNFGDLGDLSAWVSGLGGNLIATLPLLAAFLDEPAEPSPYAPVSRHFWNELYLEVEGVADVENVPHVRALIDERLDEIDALRRRPTVDHGRQAALQRRVLEAAVDALETSRRRQDFLDFLTGAPEVVTYARFRAASEILGRDWSRWPPDALDRVAESDAARYHAYVQWLCTLQVANLGRTLRLYDVDLLLDLPLGTHAQGYDVWRRRDAFVEGVSMGAPPDGFFTGGQTWGLAPLHPERARADGHAYWRRCLAFQMEVADALRIDHVMGLHRLFWVPDGFPPTEGVYVRNHADELYALLCLESQRHGCRVVGEDLGTVPPEVREEMARRDVARTVVAQFELPGSAGDAASSPPVASLATMNTHDTPPFLRYWEAGDVDDRVEHGWLDPEEAEAERAGRRRSLEATAGWLEKAGYLAPGAPHGAGEVLAGLLAWLGASRAEMAVATLEDLWLEDQPQNVPGTGAERGNWSRRTREPLEAWTADPAAQRRLLALFREDAHGGDGSE